MPGFASRLIQQDGDQLLYLVTGKQGGIPVWCYTLVPQRSQVIFMEALKESTIKPGQYGQVLLSGQGEMPSQDVSRMMEAHYNA